MIGSIFMMRAKFFGITHPQKKIIGFYELDEKECPSKVIKRCSAFNLTLALQCDTGQKLIDNRCHCVKGFYKKSHPTYPEHAECLKCHKNCSDYCSGPGENQCSKCYTLNQDEDVNLGVCKCKTGFGYFDSKKKQC
jgi:hypothetical protein